MGGSWYMLKYLESNNQNFELSLTNSTSSRCSSVSCNTEPDTEIPPFEEISIEKESTCIERDDVNENKTNKTNIIKADPMNENSDIKVKDGNIPRIDSAVTVTGDYENLMSNGISSNDTTPFHTVTKKNEPLSEVSDQRKEEEENSLSDPSPIDSLDVEILYHKILKPILNIGNPREDRRIGYIGGIRGNEELERLVTGKNPWGEVSFAMHAISPHDVMDVADCNAIMPPKATWFEPKLRSGLLVKLLDDGEELN